MTTDPKSADDLAARPFDELVAELQRIVQALEAGNLPLEESIARYREALRLHAAAEGRLRDAELTISQLGRGLVEDAQGATEDARGATEAADAADAEEPA